MAIHPEMNEGPNKELIEYIESSEVVDVWCLGCGAWRKMNANYAKHLQGEIMACKECRK